MKKIVTIIGARPQIIKAAAISRAIRTKFATELEEILLHTGQHYDEKMSGDFFRELEIPEPKYNLHVKSSKQGEQTGKMLEGIEEILMSEKPDALLVYGDTNSTLAGAIAAVKMHIPVIHIESGLRSFNKSMPEEINRIVADHSSSLLFTPTHAGVVNLQKEGFDIAQKAPFSAEKPGVFHCGDIMLDNSLYFAGKVNGQTLDKFDLKKDSYFLTTIHRPQNTDNPERLVTIMETLMEIATTQELDMVIPLHPRTNKVLTEQHNALWNRLLEHPRVQILPPASFLEMIDLENNSRFVVTDSGGVQKEAYFFRKPCLILRGETEWVEICEVNQAKLVDADSEKIKAGIEWIYSAKNQDFPPIFGDGKASEFICEQILAFLHQG
jgi:UDP-GlcNAc3NAcA epimerase